MKTTIYTLATIVISSYIFSSCGNNGTSDDSTRISDSANASGPHLDSNDLRVFTLPAPLQVSTLLKMQDIDYNENILLPSKKPAVVFTSNYSRALNLGIYTIDLSYATVYGQHQTALNYVKTMESLVKDLGISSGISSQMVKRFENNIKRQDSLYHIILQSYSQANEYFQTNKREEIGMYILSGSYLEGLYISLHSKGITSGSVLQNLIGQEKLFLENIMELLQYTEENPETVDLLQKLMLIKKEFEKISVIYDDPGKRKIVVKCNINADQLNSLLNKVTEVRNKVIEG